MNLLHAARWILEAPARLRASPSWDRLVTVACVLLLCAYAAGTGWALAMFWSSP